MHPVDATSRESGAVAAGAKGTRVSSLLTHWRHLLSKEETYYWVMGVKQQLTVNCICRTAARFCYAGRCPRPWPPEGQTTVRREVSYYEYLSTTSETAPTIRRRVAC